MRRARWCALLIGGVGCLVGCSVRAPATVAVPAADAPAGMVAENRGAGRYQWADSVAVEATGPSPVDLWGVVATATAEPPAASGGHARALPVAESEYRQPQAEVLHLAPDADVVRPGEAVVDESLLPAGGGFRGIVYGEPYSTPPPDAELAVGPAHIVEVVNRHLQVFDTMGASLVGPTYLGDFFAGTPGFPGGMPFDPNALYDDSSDRFFVGASAATAYCFGVTAGSDPTGVWNRYCFATDIGVDIFTDYPHAGVGEQAIFVGVNQSGPNPLEGRVFAVDKAKAYAGQPLGAVPSQSMGYWSTPQPTNLRGSAWGAWPTGTSVHYVLGEIANACQRAVWVWTDPFGANTFVQRSALDLCAASGVVAGTPVDVPQAGGGSPIQANGTAGHHTEWADGHLWTVQTIACNPGGGTVNCIRYAEIDPVTNTVVTIGVVGANAEYRQFPSLAVDRCGNAAIGYAKGSASTFPGAFVAGRAPADPPGALGPELVVHAGEGVYSCWDGAPYRWGDYTKVTVSPDGRTFWYVGEYSRGSSGSGCWGTWIAPFEFFSCAGIYADGFESGGTSTWSSAVP